MEASDSGAPGQDLMQALARAASGLSRPEAAVGVLARAFEEHRPVRTRPGEGREELVVEVALADRSARRLLETYGFVYGQPAGGAREAWWRESRHAGTVRMVLSRAALDTAGVALERRLPAFTVLHFGSQCPMVTWVLDQARQAASLTGTTWGAYDLTSHPELAAVYGLYLPFATVVGNRAFVPAPRPAAALAALAAGGPGAGGDRDRVPQPPPGGRDSGRGAGPGRPPATVTGPETIPAGITVETLTGDNIAATCDACAPPNASDPDAKAAWALGLSALWPGRRTEGFLGLAARKAGGRTVAAVEVLPASLVPYPIPDRGPEAAFVTCVYSRKGEADLRLALLGRLGPVASGLGFRLLYAVSGEKWPYPNGPKALFERAGFDVIEELGSLDLEWGTDRMLLMGRPVRAREQEKTP